MGLEASNTSYHPDQLVVDQQHVGAVMDLLRDLGLRFTEHDHDDGLGLALLCGLHDGAGVPVDVGDVVSLVRQRAAAQRDGWVPTIGKNRRLDAVIGIESHKPMAGSLPEQVDEHEPARAAIGGEDAGRDVCVGVVDTLEPRPQRGPVPYRAGHGRFVESLIRRYAPRANIVFKGAIDPQDGRAYSWDTARAMVSLAAEQPLDILNLSFGCFTAGSGPPLVISRAIERIGPGVLIVAAAGNHGMLEGMVKGRNRDSACWPAAIPPVVAVGAADAGGKKSIFSPARPWVHCLAEGEEVIGDYFNGPVLVAGNVVTFTGRARWSGTSFAAAIVSGAVAAATVPGKVTAAEALQTLLSKSDVVHPYAPE
jgi:membrane-anchored mycosin MYCP